MSSPQKMSVRLMSFTTPFSIRHHARLRRPGSIERIIIFTQNITKTNPIFFLN